MAPGGGGPGEVESTEQFSRLMAMLGSVELTVADTARRLASAAAAAMPCADGVALLLVEEHGPAELVASQDVGYAAVDLQRTLGEGPSIDAVALGHVVDSDDLLADGRWPRLRAGRATDGVRSVLSVPLARPPRVLGSLTAYAAAPAAFDEHTRRLAVRLAGAAARTLDQAQLLDGARHSTARLHVVDGDRDEVDRAVAVLMTENGVTADEALGVLQLLGRTEQKDVGRVARAIIAARTGLAEHDWRGAGA